MRSGCMGCLQLTNIILVVDIQHSVCYIHCKAYISLIQSKSLVSYADEILGFYKYKQ